MDSSLVDTIAIFQTLGVDLRYDQLFALTSPLSHQHNIQHFYGAYRQGSFASPIDKWLLHSLIKKA